MKKTLRVVGSTLLIFSFVFALVVLIQPTTEAAKSDYKCCTYWVKDGLRKVRAYGVFFQGRCHCTVFSPDDNPNNCDLYCPNIT